MILQRGQSQLWLGVSVESLPYLVWFSVNELILSDGEPASETQVRTDHQLLFRYESHEYCYIKCRGATPHCDVSKNWSLPLPGFGFPSGTFKQVTLDDIITAGTWADHLLTWSILKHTVSHGSKTLFCTILAAIQTMTIISSLLFAALAGVGSPGLFFWMHRRQRAGTAIDRRTNKEQDIIL